MTDQEVKIIIGEDKNRLPSATWEQEGFTIKFYTEIDPDPDLTHLGYFTNTRQSGAIAHTKAKTVRGELPWFVPRIKKAKNIQELMALDISKERAEALTQEAIMRDYDRCRTHGEDWVMLTAFVTVSMFGVDLATDYVSGVESDAGQSQLIEIARGLASDAITQAKEKLKEIVTSASPEYLTHGSSHTTCNQ